MDNINRIIQRLIVFILILLSLYVSIRGFFISYVLVNEANKIYQFQIFIFPTIILLILILLLTRFKPCFEKSKMPIVILVITNILLSLLFVQFDYPFMNDDAAHIETYAREAANLISNGSFDFSVFDCDYFLRYPWQIGVTLFETLLILVTGNSWKFIFYFINIISVLVTFYIGYLITILMTNGSKYHGNIYAVISTLFIVPVGYVTYLYGWLIGLPFLMASLYFALKYLKEKRLLQIVFSMLMLLTSGLLKPNYVLAGIAIIIVFVFNAFRKTICWKSVIISIFGFYLSLNSTSFLYSILIDRYESGVPKSMYLVMGMSESQLGNGWFNGYVDSYLNYLNDKEGLNEDVLNHLQDRVDFFTSNPKEFLKFYQEKLDSLLLVKDGQMHGYYNFNKMTYLTNSYQNGTLRDFTYGINDTFFFVFWITLLAFLIYIFKKSNFNSSAMLLMLCLIGALTYHMIFEAKTIYMFPWFFVCLPMCAIGFEKIRLFILEVTQKLNSFKYVRQSLVLLFSLLLVLTGLYNFRPIYNTVDQNYTDDQYNVELVQGKFLSFEYQPINSYELSGIGLLMNGDYQTDTTFAIEIYDQSGTLLSSNQYDVNQMVQHDDWFRFKVYPVILSSDEKYMFRFYTNATQPVMELVAGTYSGEPRISGFLTNSYKTSESGMLNIKFYDKKIGLETKKYVYQNVSLTKEIKPY